MATTVGAIVFFIVAVLMLIFGGISAIRYGKREHNNLMKGIGIVVLLIAAVTFIITMLAIYWMFTRPTA